MEVLKERKEFDLKAMMASEFPEVLLEQAWKTLHGADKLQKALDTAQVLLAKKGIHFDAVEMKVYIEAAVAEFNEAFKKPVDAETSKANYRIPETAE